MSQPRISVRRSLTAVGAASAIAGASLASAAPSTTPGASAARSRFATDHGLTIYPDTPAGNRAINKRIAALNKKCSQTLEVSANLHRDRNQYGWLSIKQVIKRKDGAHIVVTLTHVTHGSCGILVYRQDHTTVFPKLIDGRYVDPYAENGDDLDQSIDLVEAAVDRR